MSDRGYLGENEDHPESNKDIPWKHMLNDKRYSYSIILVSTDYYSEWKKFRTMFLAEVQKDSQLQSRCITELQIS